MFDYPIVTTIISSFSSLQCKVTDYPWLKRFIENLVHIIIANKSYRIILIGFNAPDCLGLLLDIS